LPLSTRGTCGLGFQCLSQTDQPSLCRSRRPRTLALQKLHRILPGRSLQASKHITLWPSSPSPSTGSAIRAVEPDHSVLRPRKMSSGQRFSYLALEPEETQALNAAYHQRIHHDQSNLIPLGSGSFNPTRSRTSWPTTATSKRHRPQWPSPGPGLPRSSFSASFCLPPKKLPIPPSSSTANSSSCSLV
jgi:hypothetical protein